MATNPFFVIVAIAFYLAPLALAILNDRQVRAFQRHSFGHFAKAARNLRILVWVIFAYYVAVLVGSFLIGELPHMWQYPMPADGVQIYLRISAVIAGFVAALFVSKELYLVTRPQ